MSTGDTPGEGPWWNVYTAEWCGCIPTVSHVSARVVFPLPSLWFSPLWVSFYGKSSLNCRGLLWPHCLVSSQGR